MPLVRMMSVVLLIVVAACSESGMEEVGHAPLPQVGPAADEVIASLPPLCATLRSEGYETRKRAVADATDTERTLAERHCAGALDRLAAARAVETASARLTGDRTTVTFQRCAATRTGFVAIIEVTNGESVPIGVYAAVRPTTGGNAAGVGAFSVIWRLAPGQSTTRRVTGGEHGDSCTVDFNVFLADPALGGDASTNAPPDPGLRSDDPAVWFPALVATERAWATAPTADGPSGTEDLRSTAYTELVAATKAAGEVSQPTADTLCSATPKSDNPALVSVVARQGGSVVGGAVRRGQDGGWRWLGTPVTLGTGPCP